MDKATTSPQCPRCGLRDCQADVTKRSYTKDQIMFLCCYCNLYYDEFRNILARKE